MVSPEPGKRCLGPGENSSRHLEVTIVLYVSVAGGDVGLSVGQPYR